MVRSGVIKWWWPAIVWMTAIFIGSTDVLSAQHTSRIIGPLLRWLVPDISPEVIGAIQWVIRKTGHAVEYAVLASLFWFALNGSRRGTVRIWPVQLAWAAWLLASLYALSDEFHQSFVGSRQGQVGDVLIDSFGAAAGVILIWWVGRFRGRWRDPTP